MKNTPLQVKPARKIERYLAIIGTVICLIVVATIWQAISAQQPMWPLPGLYLVEMLVVCALGTWSIWSIDSSQSPLRRILVWAVVGILFAFMFMGAFSVGFLFLPDAALFAIAAVLLDRKERHYQLLHIGVCLAAAIAQAVLMLVVIRLL